MKPSDCLKFPLSKVTGLHVGIRTAGGLNLNLSATYISMCKYTLKRLLEFCVRRLGNKDIYCIFRQAA
jgi:hypothetical protein